MKIRAPIFPVLDGFSPGGSFRRPRRGGFSLVELLLVVSIIVALLGLATPIFQSLGRSRGFTAAGFEIQSFLDQARSHAIANNTYVFVGIAEGDATLTGTASQTSTTPFGRIYLAAVASRDGTRGYDTSAPTTITANLLKYQGIGKLQQFDNVTLVNLQSAAVPPATTGTGNMLRPAVKSTENIALLKTATGSAACSTTFSWPLGAITPQNTFSTVINFDPRGVARIQTSTSGETIASYLEIGLRQNPGNANPAVSGTNVNAGSILAIQIDGITGVTRLYRP